MRGFLLLFRRDLMQRWMLFVASLAMGLFILAVPFLPNSHAAPAELRGVAGLVTALAWSAILALLLGSSIFVRDLVETRLAFDFRLPVRPLSIWAARLFAAIFAIALASGLVLLPAALAGMDFAGAIGGVEEALGRAAHLEALHAAPYWPRAILLLLLGANSTAMLARTRYRWAAFDFVALALLACAFAYVIPLLRFWEAYTTLRFVGLIAAGLLTAGAIGASLVQLTRGRTEPDRAQRALSLANLSVSLLTSSFLLIYSSLHIRPAISAIDESSAQARSVGVDWVEITGQVHIGSEPWPRFLVHPESGTTHQLGPGIGLAEASRDGTTIGWLEYDDLETERTSRLHILDANAVARGERPTKLTWKMSTPFWAISPDATTVATLHFIGVEGARHRLLVEEIETGTLLANVLLPGCTDSGPLFYLNRSIVLAGCGDDHENLELGHWREAFRVEIASGKVTPFAPGLWITRLTMVPPIGNPPSRGLWFEAEKEPDFEGPASKEAILRDKEDRIFWLDPISGEAKRLLRQLH